MWLLSLFSWVSNEASYEALFASEGVESYKTNANEVLYEASYKAPLTRKTRLYILFVAPYPRIMFGTTIDFWKVNLPKISCFMNWFVAKETIQRRKVFTADGISSSH